MSYILVIVLKSIESESIDLIYLDPPFFSNRHYEVIWGDKLETRSFEDRWAGGMEHYIAWLKERVEEMYRVLKKTGSIYLHCDWHADAYIRVQILDRIFGQNNFRNSIAWCYSGPSNGSMKQFPKKHDTILWFSKSKKWTFNSDKIRVPYKALNSDKGKKSIIWGSSGILQDENVRNEYLEKGRLPFDWWDDFPSGGHISPSERIGYPTQKPESLLERIITASSNEGDTVLDPFVGGGTTVAVASKLNRNFIGIDISAVAISVSEGRLEKQRDLYSAPFTVITQKYDYNEMRNSDAFEFEKFIVEKFGGTPNEKQVGDMGLDGKKDKKPVQVKRSDNIGRNVIDNFLSAAKRFDSKNFEISIKNKETVGYIIAFSFGKGAMEEVARLKNEEKIIIELVEVNSIIPLSTNPKVIISVVEKVRKDDEWFITFESSSDQRVLHYQWDFNYEKDNKFKPADIKLSKDSINSAVLFQFKSGKYNIACRATNEDGIHGMEVIKINVNGKVLLS